MGDVPWLSPDDAVVFVVAASLLALLALGIVERRRNQARLESIPLRVSVNGSRGKSTVTRLLTGALAAGGMRPLGKTTGTEPKLLLGWSGEEEDIRRRPEGANIGEQRLVTRRAAREDADAMVMECMAVDPEYQLTFHRELLDVNTLIICNALEDHLDEMGPTRHDVADVFAASVPEVGRVVTLPDHHLEQYRRAAAPRGSRVLVADPASITDEQLAGFGFFVLPDHLALVLALTRDLGISDDVALRGMRGAQADRYAMRVTPIGEPERPGYFVNGFAANDPVSTLALWEHVDGRELPIDGLTVIMHCRGDRMQRTQLFATDVLPRLPIDTLIVTGTQTRPVVREARSGGIPAGRVVDLTDQPPEAVIGALDGDVANRVVFGVGNLHGGGAEIVAAIEGLAVDPTPTSGVR